MATTLIFNINTILKYLRSRYHKYTKQSHLNTGIIDLMTWKIDHVIGKLPTVSFDIILDGSLLILLLNTR